MTFDTQQTNMNRRSFVAGLLCLPAIASLTPASPGLLENKAQMDSDYYLWWKEENGKLVNFRTSTDPEGRNTINLIEELHVK